MYILCWLIHASINGKIWLKYWNCLLVVTGFCFCNTELLSYSYTRGRFSPTNLPTASLHMHLLYFLGLYIISQLRALRRRFATLLLHSWRLINARKACLTYSRTNIRVTQFSAHCSEPAALKSVCSYSIRYILKMLVCSIQTSSFYPFQMQVVNEHTEICLSFCCCRDSIIRDLKALQYMRGSKFLDGVIISSLHWSQRCRWKHVGA